MDGNKIEDVYNISFENFVSLEEFYFCDNYINEILFLLFFMIMKLWVLDLLDNFIEYIYDGIFIYLRNLELLLLVKNRICIL